MTTRLLYACFFGSLRLFPLSDENAVSLDLPKSEVAKTLLAYLLFSRERPHSRDLLAGTFWPDLPENRARRALSQALWQIGQVFPNLLDAHMGQIEVSGEYHVELDVERFQALLNPHLPRITPGSGDQYVDALNVPSDQQAMDDLHQAVNLYGGDFLEDIYHDWTLFHRERLRERMLQALTFLTVLEKKAGRYQRALDTVLQITLRNPLNESAHREAMRLYCLLDRPAEAIHQFRICQQALRDELELDVDSKTRALAEEIRAQSGASAKGLTAAYVPTAGAREFPLTRYSSLLYLPLVGRDEERQQLVAHIEAAMRSFGGVVLIEGEAGVGKSRLLREVAQDAEWRGAEVCWGYNYPEVTYTPYTMVIEALESGLTTLRWQQFSRLMDDIWLSTLSPLFPSLQDAFPDIPSPPELEPQRAHERLLAAFTQLLVAWSRISPLVIILEDVHWAREDTMSLLLHLARQVQQHEILLILSYRGGQARSQETTWKQLTSLDQAGLRGRLLLRNLDARSFQMLIRYALGLAQAAPMFEKRLIQETGGNPLFGLEILQTLYQEGLLRRDERGQWHTPWDEKTQDYREMPLPSVVEDAIHQRILFVEPAARTVLNAAAVLHPQLEYAALHDLAGLDDPDLLGALSDLTRRGLLMETPNAYQFSHAKIRQVVYRELSIELRQAMHRQAGRFLAETAPTQHSLLAHHFLEGQVWDQAVLAYQAAGRQATGQYARKTALEALSAAREILEKQQPFDPHKNDLLAFELWDMTFPLARQAGMKEICQQAVTAMLALAAQLNTPAHRVQAELHAARYCEMGSQDDLVLAHVQEALRLAEQHDLADQQARAWLVLGSYYREQTNLPAAQDALRHAMEICDQGDVDLSQKIEAWLQMVFVYRELGEIDAARRAAEEARQMAEANDDRLHMALVDNALAWITRSQGDHQAEIAHCQSMFQQMKALGFVYYEGVALNNLSLALASTGQVKEAIQSAEQALERFLLLHHPRAQTIVILNLTSRYKEHGLFEKTHQALESGMALAAEHSFLDEEARMCLSHVELLIFEGRLDEAQTHLERATAIASQLDYPALYANVDFRWGQLALAEERFAEGLACFQQAEGKYQQAGWPNFAHLMDSYAAVCHLHLGDLTIAEQLAQKAYHHLREETEACLYYYKVMSAVGKGQQAIKALAQAWANVQEKVRVAPDSQSKHNLLEAVPIHREICVAWEQVGDRIVTVKLAVDNAPTGRPLREDEYVAVTWTVVLSEDQDVVGKTARRRHRLRRLLAEARAQGAAPTVADLASVLDVSVRTIKRDLAALRQAGYPVETRGRAGT